MKAKHLLVLKTNQAMSSNNLLLLKTIEHLRQVKQEQKRNMIKAITISFASGLVTGAATVWAYFQYRSEDG